MSDREMNSRGSPVPSTGSGRGFPSSPEPDLVNKYQKLATEYAKVRAQATVLKKALIEEQDRVLDLDESVKSKDQSIRRSEMEYAGLQFRNQQLTKRVELLQAELDRAAASRHRQSKDPSQTQTTEALEVMREELENKIAENVQLHSLLDSLKDDQSQRDEETKERFRQVEWQIQKLNLEKEEWTSRHQGDMLRLREEKAAVEYRLHCKNLEVASLKEELDKLRLQTEIQQKQRTAEGADASCEASSPLRSAVVPSCSAKGTSSPTAAVSSILANAASLLNCFKEFLERLDDIAPPTDDQAKSCSAVSSSVASLVSTLSPPHPFSASATLLAPGAREFGMALLNNALPASDNLSSYLTAFAKRFDSSLGPSDGSPVIALGGSIRRLASHVSQCSALCRRWDSEGPSLHSWLKELCLLLMNISMAVRDVSKKLNDCVMFRKRTLQGDEGSKRLSKDSRAIVEAAEELLNGFLALVAYSQKVAVALDDNLLSICDLVYKSPSSDADNRDRTSITDDLKRGVEVCLSAEGRSPPPGAPPTASPEPPVTREQYEQAVRSKEALASDVAALTEKIVSLEQSREQWILETRILQAKLEKVTSAKEPSEAPSLQGRDLLGGITGTSMLGKVSSVSTVQESTPEAVASACAEREKQTRAFYESRLGSYISLLQVANSKATAFQKEMYCMQEVLSSAEDRLRDAELASNAKSRELADLRAEFQALSLNYESQIALLSDHLASVNARLAQRNEEVEELEYQLKQQNSNKKTMGNLFGLSKGGQS
ncbi:unnamed protein product [Cyprideis torosa]|uniref:Protein phosphatase 1 regulatory subunit 21 N-terminal domain-containing protein n=1 Tax=Cyprideis torosa TaxID=163714 RepID=A0A7R8W7T4_9CRUS|nr:unnamed protein product [Cyprideis torosa]CAG0887901.1 unnamed protein product [Cyprideis torosa]